MRFARRGLVVKKKNGSNGGHGGGKPNGKPRTMNERFDALEQILKSHGADIRNVKNGVAHLRDRVKRLEDDLGHRVKRIEDRVGRIEDHLGLAPPEG